MADEEAEKKEQEETGRIARILSGLRNVGSKAGKAAGNEAAAATKRFAGATAKGYEKAKNAAKGTILTPYQDYKAKRKQDGEYNERAEALMTDEQKEMSDQRRRWYPLNKGGDYLARGGKAAGGIARGIGGAGSSALRGVGRADMGVIGGAAALSGGAMAGVAQGGTLFIILALLITIFDGKWFRLDFLGPPFLGFEFDLLGATQIDWLGILFGWAFAFILVLRTLFKFFESDESLFGWIIFLVILAKLKESVVNLPPQINVYWSYIGIAAIALLSFLIRWMRQEAKIITREDATFLFFAYVTSFFLMNRFWTTVPMAIAHFAFIAVFGFLYIIPNEKQNPSKWHMFLSLLMIADFFLAKYLEETFLQSLPFLFIFTGVYVIIKEPENAKAKYIVAPVVLTALFIGIFSPSITQVGDLAVKQIEDKEIKTVKERFVEAVKQWYETRLTQATGGLYRGRVEDNQYEKLGVYFEQVRASEPRFYTDQPITIWGSIKSKTLSDAVFVNFNCYKWTSDGKKIQANKIDPKDPFSIFNLEERDVECTFDTGIGNDEEKKKQRFSAGTHIVTMSADYNFATDAYLKAYFIDRDRYRAMIREELDPFEQYGITDKVPVAIYTNGPVEIGMDITPLTPVGRIDAIRPTLGLTLINRGRLADKTGKILGEWEGRIKNITELVILLPEGISIVSPETDCGDKKFKKYETKDCENSCTEYIHKPCENVCIKGFENRPSQLSPDEQKAYEDENKNCLQDCGDARKKCLDDCSILFQGDDTKYNGYALNVEELDYRDELKDIDKYRTFRCRLMPTSEVLGSTPITTKFIRAKARYNYQLDKSVNVPVDLAPGTISQDITGIMLDESEGREVPKILPLAIAHTESRFRHCCRKAGENKDGNCEFVADRQCERNRVLESFAASQEGHYSIGIMQINEGNQKYTKDCETKDLKDLQCNIKAGFAILEENYNNYKAGLPESYLETCKKQNPGYYEKYKSYRGWQAALRAYNGPACRNEEEGTYVERVLRNACAIASGEITLENAPDILKVLSDEDKKKIECP